MPDDTGTMESGQKVTWDCVWFGSYPQTEVVSEDDTAKITALKNMNTNYETKYDTVTSTEFTQIENVAKNVDSNGDFVVGTEKYRRIKKTDATGSWDDDETQYSWTDGSSYHYFKYEPIKWRVLNVENGKALLLADAALDDQQYNTEYTDITWEKSTIRSFLNNYGSSVNMVGNDYSSRGFLNNAFSASERGAISTASLTNAGNDTSDKIFLLSESDVWSTDTAESYGFVKDYSTYDEARRCKTSTYAYAMGIERSFGDDEGTYAGNCIWWLRSPGALVGSYGWGGSEDVDYVNHGVRPALYLNLSLTDQYSLAGTVCSDGTVSEVAAPGSSGTTNPTTPSTEKENPTTPASGKTTGTKTSSKVSGIAVSGVSQKIAAGKKITLSASITPASASGNKLKWTSSNTKVATVTQNGVVTFKKNSGGKSVTITAAAQDGSGKKAVFKIKAMKGVVKKVTIKGKKTVKAGKKLKLKVAVKATKGANKKLIWKSSNTKYATVNAKGVVKTKKAGKGKKVKITAMATDGSGKKASVKIRIKK